MMPGPPALARFWLRNGTTRFSSGSARAGAAHAGGDYRPEIDGLRAIAVGLVILYHAKFRIGELELFPGGFIGVDIFLVISGYLIGRILLREMEADRFSLIRFYERRARRILPVLYVVLAVTLPFAWWLMLPAELSTYGASLTSAAGSFSNIFFWKTSSYDAGDNLTAPLLHTWSLGLEEQFYLIFPALLMMLWRFARRRLMSALLIIATISFCTAEVMTAQARDASFFLLPSRMWELTVGAMLALRELHDDGTSPRASGALPLIGLAAILTCVPFMSTHYHHPGFLTLVPVMGTAAIIRYAGQGDLAGRWLSTIPMVSVGLISYSLYLWHQPIFAFGRLLRVDEAPTSVKLGWIMLSIPAAVMTYYLVERPVRDRCRVGTRSIWIVAVVGAVVLAGAGLLFVMTSGAPQRFAKPMDSVAKAATVHEAGIMQDGKGCMNYVLERGPCLYSGQNPRGLNLLLIGDSHARLLSNALIERVDKDGLGSVTLLARGGCLFLPGFTRVDDGIPSCPDSYNQARLNYALNRPHAVAVIMMRLPVVIEQGRFDNRRGGVEPGSAPHVSRANGPYDRSVDDEAIRSAIVATVQRLVQQGVKVVLVYPVPEMGWNIPRKLLQLARSGTEGAWQSPDAASVSREQFLARSRRSYALLDSVGVHPDIIRLYPEQLFCRGVRCISHDGASVFYRDDNHLSQAGADRLAAAITGAIADHWGQPAR